MPYAVFRLFVAIGGEESGDPDNTRTTKQQAVWLCHSHLDLLRAPSSNVNSSLSFVLIHSFQISLELLFAFLTVLYSSEVFLSWFFALATPL